CASNYYGSSSFDYW
nr:immunoglobulin heavy chain junction region [Mus musculus]